MAHRKFLGALFTVVLGGVFAAACGDGEPNDPGSGSGGSVGGAPDGGSTGGTGTLSCAETQLSCDGFCASVQSDPSNCGECGSECDTGEGCLEGECVNFGCPTGQVTCDEACVSLQTDEANCGSCGNACGAGEMCLNGQCETACTEAQLVCDDSCVDPLTDRDYCGALTCDDGAGGAGNSTVCGSGEVCQAGECVNSCPPGQLECGGKCVDPLGSAMYCGATDCSAPETSGQQCGEDESCSVGECRTFLRKWNEARSVSVAGWSTGSNESDVGSDDEGDVVVLFRQFQTADPVNPNFMYVNHFDAQTKTWSGPRRISTSSDRTTTNPALAVAANGDAVAVWAEVNVPPENWWDIKLARYTKASDSWSAPITVDSGDGFAFGPDVAIDGSGVVHLTYTQDIDATASFQYRVAYRKSTDGGQIFSAPIVFEGFGELTGTASNAGFPHIAVNDAGVVAVTWRQAKLASGEDSNTLVAATIYDPIEDTWTTPRILSDAFVPTSSTNRSVVDAVGNVTTAFNEKNGGNSDIVVAQYDAASETWGASFTLVDEDTDVLRPILAGNDSGDLAMAYRYVKADSVDVVVLRMDGDFGNLLARTVDNVPGAASTPLADVVISPEADVHVIWANGQKAYADDYTAKFQNWGGAVELNAGKPSFAGTPRVTISPPGQVYTSWYGAGEFWVARFD